MGGCLTSVSAGSVLVSVLLTGVSAAQGVHCGGREGGGGGDNAGGGMKGDTLHGHMVVHMITSY